LNFLDQGFYSAITTAILGYKRTHITS